MRSRFIHIIAMLVAMTGCDGLVTQPLGTNPTGQPVDMELTVVLTVTGDFPVSSGGYVAFRHGHEQYTKFCLMPDGQRTCTVRFVTSRTESRVPPYREGDEVLVTAAKGSGIRDTYVANTVIPLKAGTSSKTFKSEDFGTAAITVKVTPR